MILSLILLSCLISSANLEKEDFNGREYYLYLPQELGKDAPLVLVLHGYGGDAAKENPRMMTLASKYGFALCYPQGLVDAKGGTCWNVGYPFQKDYKVDDVDFLCKLVRHLQRKYGLSKANTFLTGMSNGGEMCYLMAMNKPKVFKAIASIAGLTLANMDRNYSEPIPFMEVHGTEDRISEWNGDPTNAGGWGEYLPVPLALSYLIAVNKCVSEEITYINDKLILHKYLSDKPLWKGGPNSEVWLYERVGGDHSWGEGDMDTCEEIWKFFSKYIEL